MIVLCHSNNQILYRIFLSRWFEQGKHALLVMCGLLVYRLARRFDYRSVTLVIGKCIRD